jgi:hypothetical protein
MQPYVRVGTWKLDLAKSVFAGVPAVKSQTRTYSRSANGVQTSSLVFDRQYLQLLARKGHGSQHPRHQLPDSHH